MTKFILVVWLVYPSNFAVVDEFKTLEDCNYKLSTYKKALLHAESKLVAECRKND